MNQVTKGNYNRITAKTYLIMKYIFYNIKCCYKAVLFGIFLRNFYKREDKSTPDNCGVAS